MLTKAVLIEESKIPEIRSILCHKLNLKGCTQSEISSILKITQPMVSKYLSEKHKKSKENKQSKEKNIDDFSEKILVMAEKTKSLGFSLAITEAQITNSEYFLSTEENILTHEKSEILNNIHNAAVLLELKDLSLIVSNVKMNIAMAEKNAQKKEQIASIPGGIIIANSHLLMYSEPEFNASRHLSEILLYIRNTDDKIHAIMNIKYSPEILAAIKKLKLSHSFLTEDYKIKQTKNKKSLDALIHKGSFGIEPCTYILGESAVESVKKVLKIINANSK